jgi:hypothetical protein
MAAAVWLWDLAEDRFASAIKTLDLHHASQQLWAVGRSSPSALNSKTDSEIVVGSGSDQALPICCA